MTSSTLLIEEILSLLPHRYPFLLIDRVEEFVAHQSGIGIKNVSINEPFFQGHFPGRPIMPGVLIIEALAQTAGAVVMKSLQTPLSKQTVYFMSIEEAKFRKPVVPGNTLRLNVTKIRQRGPVWRFRGEAWVDHLVSEATFTAMIAQG